MAEPDLIDAYLIHLHRCVRFRRDADDVVAEAEDHVREAVDRLCRSGTDPMAAQRIALERFGDPTVGALLDREEAGWPLTTTAPQWFRLRWSERA